MATVNCNIKEEKQKPRRVFRGPLVHATDSVPFKIIPDAMLGVIGSKIEFVARSDELATLKARYDFDESDIYQMTSDQFMMPGLVDTHTHAPQHINNGLALDLPLLEWLQVYTFPAEARFHDIDFAKTAYHQAVDRLVAHGTTTASYYGTLHLPATKVLVDAVLEKGQRAFVGKVNMMVECPPWYKEPSVEESVQETENFIHYVQEKKSSLVHPIVTPRFAITCPAEQMLRLGQLALKHDCHLQTHLGETRTEAKLVQKLFPNSKSMTHLYDSMNLLTPKTVLAHCVWLNDEEVELLQKRGSGVSHCPNSNLSIRSGLCDVRRLIDCGIAVGLGSDCSGGYSPSLLDAMRHAVQTSNVFTIEREASAHRGIGIEDAFGMATLGGAKVLRLDHKIGNFEVGKEFDALLIDVASPGSPIDTLPMHSLKENVHKFLFLGDDRNIHRVYVAGRLIHGAEPPSHT